MRVVHLSTGDIRGGAARSAWRLHEGLLELGCDSTMLVRDRASTHPSVQARPAPRDAGWRFWEALAYEFIWCNRTSVSTAHFSIGEPGLDVSRESAVAQADLIHLHWVSDFLSDRSLEALAGLGKPLVWTLHDQRPFTGGCHFTGPCVGYETDCARCPQLRRNPWQMTQRVLADSCASTDGLPVSVVSPSQWLATEARRSRRFREQRVSVIPYGVPAGDFFLEDKVEARRRLQLPGDAFLLLSGADRADEKRKGLSLLIEAFQHLPAVNSAGLPVRLFSFGNPHPSFAPLGERAISLGYLRDPQLLRLAYAAADVFVLPSMDDNLPNTMLEALACGTPVAAFAVGGMPDVIRDGHNGWLIPEVTSAALAAKLTALVDAPTLCRECGQRGAAEIAKSFTTRSQAERYLELYHSLPRNVAPPRRRTMGRLRRAAPLLAMDIVLRRGVRGGVKLLREGFRPPGN